MLVLGLVPRDRAKPSFDNADMSTVARLLSGLSEKDDDEIVACLGCSERDDETLKFVLLGPQDEAFGI